MREPRKRLFLLNSEITTMDTYAIVNEKIISLLEGGIVPWRKPWASTGLPRNLVSKKPYRGVNVFLLSASKYVSPFWLTFRQANELGGHVRKGEESSVVTFWKVEDVKQRVQDLDAEASEGKTRRRFFAQIVSRVQCRTVRTAASCDRQVAEDRDAPTRPDRIGRADHSRNAEPAGNRVRRIEGFLQHQHRSNHDTAAQSV